MYGNVRFRHRVTPDQTILITCYNPRNNRRAFLCDATVHIHHPEKPILAATIEGFGGLKS
jgi:hypothetical protein